MFTRLGRSSALLMILGVLFIALAAVTRFVVTPALTKLPGDTDITAHYTGTATMLNSTASAAHDTAHAVAKDVPITMDRHVYVTATDGDTATAHDDVTTNLPGAEPKTDGHVYQVDRTTMEATQVSGAGSDPAPISGIDFTLPLHPTQHDYTIYDTATKTTVPLTYAGEGTVSGRDTYHYDYTASGPLQNEASLQGLPPALPKTLIGQILPMLPAATQQALNTSMNTLPDAVPLSYTVTTTGALEADRTVGAPLDAHMTQTVVANVSVGDTKVPLLPLLDVKAAVTDQTIADGVSRTADAAKILNVVSVVVPVVLLVLGVALIVLGFVRRRPTTDASAQAPAGQGPMAAVE